MRVALCLLQVCCNHIFLKSTNQFVQFIYRVFYLNCTKSILKFFNIKPLYYILAFIVKIKPRVRYNPYIEGMTAPGLGLARETIFIVWVD